MDEDITLLLVPTGVSLDGAHCFSRERMNAGTDQTESISLKSQQLSFLDSLITAPRFNLFCQKTLLITSVFAGTLRAEVGRAGGPRLYELGPRQLPHSAVNSTDEGDGLELNFEEGLYSASKNHQGRISVGSRYRRLPWEADAGGRWHHL